MHDSIPTEAAEILSEKVLGQELECTCGRVHRVRTRRVVVAEDLPRIAGDHLGELLPGRRAMVVADGRTWRAAGDDFINGIAPTFEVDRYLLGDGPGGHIHASVELVDDMAGDIVDEYDFYVAVGSGTVNDLTKELAHRRGRPYVVVATAASMNGYTSAIVALLEKGLKTTREATPPVAVLADPGVLSRAPRELTLAGLGDLVSKPFCGCDWKIASLVKGEYHCPMPDRLLSGPFDRALGLFPRLAGEDREAVAALFELLLISGLSMAVTGTSSPASGGEHLISHYWDMTRLRDGRPTHLHGAQVGVGSLLMHDLYSEISKVDLCAAVFDPSPPTVEAERHIREVFGSLAGAVWPQWRAKLEDRSAGDLERLCSHAPEISREIRRTLEVGAKIREALTAAGAPVHPGDLGIDGHETAEAIRRGREIRTRFTVLDVAAELGILESFAARFERKGPG